VSLIQFTELEIEEAILGLDGQKGSGPDGIPPSVLKKLLSTDFFVQPVLIFWNFSCGLERSFHRANI
jgi:hypothetical protein